MNDPINTPAESKLNSQTNALIVVGILYAALLLYSLSLASSYTPITLTGFLSWEGGSAMLAVCDLGLGIFGMLLLIGLANKVHTYWALVSYGFGLAVVNSLPYLLFYPKELTDGVTLFFLFAPLVFVLIVNGLKLGYEKIKKPTPH